MFGIGMPELIIILIVALIIFGPKRLPEMGKSLGRAIKEFRKTSQELKEEIKLDIHESPEIEERTKNEQSSVG
ncbi:MAG: TatA/E family twin arginine-targeting protein translocase [bacterium]|nr:TatA/E family twin arginine-targeting protein translocase [bacterium]